MRLRFRISALFWTTAIVAAFFVGRRSDDIGSNFRRWWQVTRICYGGEIGQHDSVVQWPPHAVTINDAQLIRTISIDDANVCNATRLGDHQLRINPNADGETTVHYTTPNQPRRSHFKVTVENGKIVDGSLERPMPPTQNSNQPR